MIGIEIPGSLSSQQKYPGSLRPSFLGGIISTCSMLPICFVIKQK